MRFSIAASRRCCSSRGRQIVEQVVGLADKDTLKQMIDKHLSPQRRQTSSSSAPARPD